MTYNVDLNIPKSENISTLVSNVSMPFPSFNNKEEAIKMANFCQINAP
jgi:hypothetical protein